MQSVYCPTYFLLNELSKEGYLEHTYNNSIYNNHVIVFITQWPILLFIKGGQNISVVIQVFLIRLITGSLTKEYLFFLNDQVEARYIFVTDVVLDNVKSEIGYGARTVDFINLSSERLMYLNEPT